MSPEAPIRVIVGAIGSKSWFDDGSLRRPKEIVHATLVGEGESDEHSLGRAVAEIFEGLGSELEPVVLARLEWTWGFFEVASFVRVGLDSEWHVYLGSEDVERARCLLAATKTPTIEADRALLASAFHKGGESIGMPFVYNAPSDAHFHEQFTFKEKVGWLVDAVGDDDNNWGVVFENLDEPEEWDGWPPAEEPEEPRSALPRAEIDAKREAIEDSDLGLGSGLAARWAKHAEVDKRLRAWVRRQDPEYAKAMRVYRAEHAAWERELKQGRMAKMVEYRHHLMGRYAREYMGWRDA